MNRNILRGITVVIALAVTAAVRGDDRKAALSTVPAALQKFVGKEIAGAVTLVETRNEVLALDAVGDSDMAGPQPMNRDSIFWIASMTKPITATAVMMLQEEGKLSVDDPVARYLPELGNLRTADGRIAHVTLRHLLTHTSGLAEPTQAESRSSKTLAELIPHFAERPLHFTPGSKWEYSQSGLNSLGRIIEVASGESLPQFMQKRLFDPLGMKDTTFYLSVEQVARMARSYKLAHGKLEEVKTPFLSGRTTSFHDHYPAANGGLFSTAADYGRFCRMILNEGTLDGKKYLKPETVKLMTSVQSGDVVTGFTPGNGWGLGWCVVRKPQGLTASLSPGSFGHGGAYGTQAWIDPVAGVAYILLVQRADFPNSDASDVRAAFQNAAAAALGIRSDHSSQ